MKTHKKIFFLLLFSLYGCSTTYQGKSVYGADEFVLDSYKIREGKLSILEMQGESVASLSPDALQEYQDCIHEDDIMQIALYQPRRADLMQAVDGIGQKLGYPLIDGKVYLPDLPPVEIVGLTLGQATEKMQKAYRSEIGDVEVFIGYKDRKFRKVELAGLVALSYMPVDGKIRLFDVLATAKVPPNANLFKSYFIRDNAFFPVDFYKLLKEGDMKQNVVMRGGDKIYIAEPSAATLMIMGEVASEKVLDIPHGMMSLRMALAAAGGIPFTGDRSYIQIIRGNIANPKIYVLSWEHVIHLPNDSLLLMPGDIVYVAPKPITEWNRFISQVLPLGTGIEWAGKFKGLVLP